MSRTDMIKPYQGNEPYVFISYSPADWNAVCDIIADFSQRGYRIWFDVMHSAADSYSAIVTDRIEKCEIFLCVLSTAYTKDPKCVRELAFARSNRKTLLPIMIEDIQLPPHLQFSLSATHWLNLSQFDSVSKMTDRICEVDDQRLQSCIDRPVRKPERKAGFFERLTGKWKNKENKETGKANFSILSPKAVKPDSYGIIQLHMYTDAERSLIDRAIEEAGGVVSETAKTGFEVAEGISVTARLESGDVEIRDNLETQVWNGKHLLYDFQFFVPEDYPRSQAAFTCYIECNGIPITRLNFIVAVMKIPDQQSLPAKVTRSDYSKAFISYSRKDEQRMLARVLGIKELAPNMVFWLDKQSLDAGDLWREEIRKAIQISDVLLLFWSIPASQSKEVEKEWRYGFEQKGLSFIAPVPLDPPSECPPPDSLKPLNFTVRAFSTNEITEQLTFYNSDNIRLI